MERNILMVEDEIQLRKILAKELEEQGYTVFQAGTGEEALAMLEKKKIKVLLLDLMLPDMTGLDLLPKVSSLYPNIKTIILTAYGNVESAVTAMKLGAFDYLCKPVKLEELKLFLDRAFNWIEMQEENEKLKQLVRSKEKDDSIISRSPAMERVCYMIDKVAESDANVLIEGESGTGKSLVAKRIHNKSLRKKGPFITVNCAAIPENLIESELFGHVKGAFTGATESREGKFAAADGGTIFLDEIGELPLPLQAKLLHVTQEKSFTRLGSNKINKVDVRIIAATNKDLSAMVEKGEFREDLYYRLNIVKIKVPPLRKRKEDIPLLITQFLSQQEKKLGKKFRIQSSIIEPLMQYDWPGNIRELKNVIERVTILSSGGEITMQDFPPEIWEDKIEKYTRGFNYIASNDKSLPEQLEEIEKKIIIQTLNKSNGNYARAAKMLKISRQSLKYKLDKYNLRSI